MSGVLSRAVAEACGELRSAVAPDTAARIEAVLTRLDGPLQLAVAGRIKSGKSTVVNTLIGRRVAPTDVRECTRLVTRFQYGTVDRVEVVALDGSRRTLPYDRDGLVPADLGAEPNQIAYLDAFLTSASLLGLTVIDTPGLGSLDAASARRTEVLLGAGAPVPVEEILPAAGRPGGPGSPGGPAGPGSTGGPGESRAPGELAESGGAGLDAGSRVAIAQAEAVLYVLTQAARAADADALAIFKAYSTPQASSPINALGVLNKADQVVPGPGVPDEWAAATALAASQAHALRQHIWDVRPLVGIVAEATETGHFTQADADALRQLAALDPASRELLFFSTDLFVRPGSPVPVAARSRLLERLDLFGIRRAVDLLMAEPGLTAGELRRRLADLSGFPAVRGLVESTLRRRADGIKASVALAALDTVAARATMVDRIRIREVVEELIARPEAHLLPLLQAAAQVTGGRVRLPDELAGELSRLVGSDDPGEQLGRPGAPVDALRANALETAARWRSFATFGSTPEQSRIAHVVHRGFFLVWQRLRDGGGP
jgi:Dynamin family